MQFKKKISHFLDALEMLKVQSIYKKVQQGSRPKQK